MLACLDNPRLGEWDDGANGCRAARTGEGTHLSERTGTLATFKARWQDTAGGYTLIEWEHEPSAPGPPLHIHDHEEEAFYVVNGTGASSLATSRQSPAPGPSS
jgi:mannose-6-phosphate isomerase-like protein (cupin superfamily)